MGIARNDNGQAMGPNCIKKKKTKFGHRTKCRPFRLPASFLGQRLLCVTAVGYVSRLLNSIFKHGAWPDTKLRKKKKLNRCRPVQSPKELRGRVVEYSRGSNRTDVARGYNRI